MIFVSKIFYFLISLTLIAFAGLQFNDPDPFLWVTFYLICALVPSLLLFNKFYRPLFWIAASLCAIQMSISVPGAYQYYLHMTEEPLMQSMNPAKPYIEECREFLGALIALGLNFACVVIARVKLIKR